MGALGGLGSLLDRLFIDFFIDFRAHLGTLLGGFGVSWGSFLEALGSLGASWGLSWSFLASLGASWADLGGLLVSFFGIFHQISPVVVVVFACWPRFSQTLPSFPGVS